MNEDPGPLKRPSAANVSAVRAKKRCDGSNAGNRLDEEVVYFQFSDPNEDTKEGIDFECTSDMISHPTNQPVLQEPSLGLAMLPPPGLVPLSSPGLAILPSTQESSHSRHLVITTLDQRTPLITQGVIKVEPEFFTSAEDSVGSWNAYESIKSENEIKQEPTWSTNEIKQEPTWGTNEIKQDDNGPSKSKYKFTNKKRTIKTPPPSPPPPDPLEAFRLLLDDNILDLIVRETNLRAQKGKQQGVTGCSRLNSWTELTRGELLKFLALLLHTGTIRLTRLNDYWKKHWLFNINCFAQYMSRNRFMLILRCLSLSSEDNKADRLAMIRPMMHHFNNKMEQTYYPRRQLTIDRSMMISKGDIIFRKNIKKRKYKSITMHTLADIEGIVLKCHLHDGANQNSETEDIDAIVLNLLEKRLDSGYSVYMDSYYNSYTLANELLARNTHCTGVLNKDRKDNPIDINSVKVEEGQNQSVVLNDVHIGKWVKNKQSVVYVSTEHDCEMLRVENKSGEAIMKPAPLVHCNKVMNGGINLQDKMLAYYPCEAAARNLRFHKKLIIHFLQMYLSNAFYMYKKYCGDEKITFYNFRLAVLEKLLPNESTKLKNILRNAHSLTKIEQTRTRLKKDGDQRRIVREVARKECKGCKKKLKKRVSTIYECKACDGAPGYCTQCFCIAHTEPL